MPKFYIYLAFFQITIATYVCAELNDTIIATKYAYHDDVSNSLMVTSRSGSQQQLCADFCWNGSFCGHERCQGCFFACPSQSCRRRKVTCDLSCGSNVDCSRKMCRKCRWCNHEISNSTNINAISNSANIVVNETIKHSILSNEAGCSVASFRDKTSVMFSKSKTYLNQWTHSGKPYFHEGAPVFFDIDNDGTLDYFNSMHGHKSREFKNRMELGISTRMDTTDEYTYSMESYRIINNDLKYDRADMHGEVIADLDGDGILDMFISNGGGQYIRNKNFTNLDYYDNWLFWGSEVMNQTSNKTETFFTGGRDAARRAGVEMKLGRGRFNYLLDINGDGLLDIFSSQDRRVRNDILPGILLINQGNRTWKRDENMMEYSRTMMITDADGDGFAREFIINRSFCYPQRKGPDVDPSKPELGPYPQAVKQFCHTRPVGSNVVYAFNKTSNQVEQISRSYKKFWAKKKQQRPCCSHGSYSGANDCHAQSMASGDFDEDGRIDHVQLYSSKMMFFFSSDRKAGALPDNSINISFEIKLPNYCSKAMFIRVVDFDNDGKEEIFIGCQNVGTFLLYTRGDSKYSWTLNNDCNDNETSLGDLGLRDLAAPSNDDMSSFCDEFEGGNWGSANNVCRLYHQNNHTSVAYLAGVAIADINNDGFLDVTTTHDFGYLRIFHNVPSPKSIRNRFITFRLKGDIRAKFPNNVYGIGATLILKCLDRKSGKETRQVREISSFQHSTDKYGSKEDRVIFGLGTDLVPKRIQVRWPSGRVQGLSLNSWVSSSSSADVVEIFDIGDGGEFMLRLVGHHEHFCIGTGPGNNWEEVKLYPCSTQKKDLWSLDLRGRLISAKYPAHCLSPSSDMDGGLRELRLEPCSTVARFQSWFLTSTKEIRFEGSELAIQVKEVSHHEKIYLGPRQQEKSALMGWIRISKDEATSPGSFPSFITSIVATSNQTTSPTSSPSMNPFLLPREGSSLH